MCTIVFFIILTQGGKGGQVHIEAVALDEFRGGQSQGDNCFHDRNFKFGSWF